MKKVLVAFLSIVMLVSLAGCGSASKPETTVGAFCEALKTLDVETASTCFASGESGLKNPYAGENATNTFFMLVTSFLHPLRASIW